MTGVETNRGTIETDLVVNCTAAWASSVAAMVGLDLPMVTHPLQAMVTEPLKPLLDIGVSSTNFHVYVYQTDRGELVIGGAVDHYTSYSYKSTFPMIEELSAGALEDVPVPEGREHPEAVDGDMRHDTGLCADHGEGVGARRVPAELWVGDVRVQGSADIGEDDGGANRVGGGAGPDKAVHAGPVPGWSAGE